MPEETQRDPLTENDEEMYSCPCGEQHRHRPGSRSHREECTSSLKFGDTCCCGSGNDDKTRNRCGHGPRCH